MKPIEWQPFETVPQNKSVYARFADGFVETGTWGRDINGLCWAGADRFYHETSPADFDAKPIEWRAITDEDTALATALVNALLGSGGDGYVSSDELTRACLDGNFDLVLTARAFAEAVELSDSDTHAKHGDAKQGPASGE